MSTTKTKKRKKRTTKKKSGISRRGWLALVAGSAWGQGNYALIVGTVFQENGLAFSGAEVRLTPLEKRKGYKGQTLRTTGRGEFSFRLPVGKMEFEVGVTAAGYRAETKRVKIESDERVDLSFLMERAK